MPACYPAPGTEPVAVQRWAVAAAPVVQAPFLHASEVTAVDASPEMLAIATARVGPGRVRFVQAGLFTWTPDRRYVVGHHPPAAP